MNNLSNQNFIGEIVGVKYCHNQEKVTKNVHELLSFGGDAFDKYDIF